VFRIAVRIVVSTLLSILAFQVAQAQSVGYPLVCRSGGGMQLSWSALFNARTNLIAYFDRAPKAAGVNAPLQSGQCAWIDRPMNSGEAGAMLWNLDATLAIRFKANGSSTPVVGVTGDLTWRAQSSLSTMCALPVCILRLPSTTRTQAIWL
jgi:hypothetical protein